MATLSSHTLNGADGTHAGGIHVTLKNMNTNSILFTAKTDTGGRLAESIDISAMDPTDRYELTFDTGAYWDSRGIDPTLRIDEIVLRLNMPDANARYHMPIIFSPNSYSMWASLPEA